MKPSPASSPSVGLMRFSEMLAGTLVLDAPCGYGRNSIALALCGCKVIAADHDRRRLDSMMAAAKQVGINRAEIEPVRCDLSERGWCFGNGAFDGVICVHFDFRTILSRLLTAVRSRGYVYIETFGGQGRNYLDLPPAGFLKQNLSGTFDINWYGERKVGPSGIDAVAVQTFCRRRR